jgi:hypothetical protein
MKFAKCLALFLAPLLLLFIACKKRGASGNVPLTVYVSGYVDTLGQSTGAYWANDSLNIVSGPSQLNGVAYAGKNLYLLDGSGYWENGNFSALPNVLNTSTCGIVVNGTDVYITGYTSISESTATAAAIYWKNGVQVSLTQNISNVTNAFLNSLFISGTDVYGAGLLAVNYRNGQGVYWKNDSLVYLPDCYMPEAIGVVNGTVYVAGLSLTQGSAYWVNGTEMPLTDNGYVNAMAISGNDVYIAGFTGGAEQAVYWKNGQPVMLPNGTSATGIAVSGNDVYVCGNGGNNDAVYWKNGVIHLLGTGGATGIAIGN